MLGLTTEEFWRSCPRAIIRLSRIQNESLGLGKAKKKDEDPRGPRLSYIPR